MLTAVRLGSLRDPTDPVPTMLERVAAAGFDGVAFVGLDEQRLQPVAEALLDTGLVPVAARVPYDRLQGERKQVVRELRTVGCERVVLPPLHEAHFETRGEVARMATRLSALGGRLAADGRSLCYLNGTREFRPVDGGDAYEVLVERAGDGLGFELDVGDAAAAGRDPVALLERLSGRVPLVRLRDVDADGEPTTLGEGSLDLGGVVGAAREAGTEWLVHEPRDPAAPRSGGAAVLDDLPG